MKRIVLSAALLAFLFALSVAQLFCGRADCRRPRGRPGSGRTQRAFLVRSNTHTSFVVRTDESPTYLFFIWDGKDLEPWVRIEKKGDADRRGGPDQREQGHPLRAGDLHSHRFRACRQRPLAVRRPWRPRVGSLADCSPVRRAAAAASVVLARMPRVGRAKPPRLYNPTML